MFLLHHSLTAPGLLGFDMGHMPEKCEVLLWTKDRAQILIVLLGETVCAS